MSKLTTVKSLGVVGLFWVVVAWFLLIYYKLIKNTEVASFLHKMKHQQISPKTNASINADDLSFTKAKSCYQFIAIAEKYHFINGNCLLKCFVLQWFLKRYNIAHQLIVGVKYQEYHQKKHQNTKQDFLCHSLTSIKDKTLTGHIWVEVNDKVVSDRPESVNQYQRVNEFKSVL